MALEVSFVAVGAWEVGFSSFSCIQTCLIPWFRQVCFVLLVQQWSWWDSIQYFLHSQFMILDLVIYKLGFTFLLEYLSEVGLNPKMFRNGKWMLEKK